MTSVVKVSVAKPRAKSKAKTKPERARKLIDNRFKNILDSNEFDKKHIRGDKLYKAEGKSGNSLVITKFPRRIQVEKCGLCFYFYFTRTILGGTIEYLRWMVPVKYARMSQDLNGNSYTIEILKEWIDKSNLKKENWSII